MTAPLLGHYSLTAENKVVVDALLWAMGAVLLQKQTDYSYRPIAYGSRSLTEIEQTYGHINREALAMVYECKHFHMYLTTDRWSTFTRQTPSKPTSVRLERWRI